MVELLISHGAYIDHQDENGFTPLMLTVEKGHVHAVQTLLKAGVGTEPRNKDGLTALMYAPTGGVEIARHLVNAGADIYARIYYGINVMHTAATLGNAQFMKLFMDEGLGRERARLRREDALDVRGRRP